MSCATVERWALADVPEANSEELEHVRLMPQIVPNRSIQEETHFEDSKEVDGEDEGQEGVDSRWVGKGRGLGEDGREVKVTVGFTSIITLTPILRALPHL